MSASNDTTKVCIACNTEKSLSEYYRWSSNGKYMDRCKKCHKAQTKRAAPIPANKCGVEHQNELLKTLFSIGIYAAPGKSSEYAHADIVAWGCVRIEVKLGETIDKYNPTMWKFRFTKRQVDRGLIADLLVLMCPNGAGMGYTYYVMNPGDPALFLNGKRKAALSINLGTHHKNRSDGKRPLSEELLNASRDNWQLIEQKRVEVVAWYQLKGRGA